MSEDMLHHIIRWNVIFSPPQIGLSIQGDIWKRLIQQEIA